MTDEIKKLIASAPIRREGYFSSFLIIPSGEKYGGFWGENGYNNIILLGGNCEGWFNITDSADSVMFSGIKHINFDVPNENNSVRFWFDEPIYINNELNLSTLLGRPAEKGENDECDI